MRLDRGKVGLELGGNAPFIVSTSRLDAGVSGAMASKFAMPARPASRQPHPRQAGIYDACSETHQR
jgi:hypothetical protein